MNDDDLILRDNILGNFDFAFNINWEDKHQVKIHTYLTSLTMYFGTKMNGHVMGLGSYLAYRFNQRDCVEERVELYRRLFKNESPNTFEEINCNGCCVFKI
jgi:hypothetical protein